MFHGILQVSGAYLVGIVAYLFNPHTAQESVFKPTVRGRRGLSLTGDSCVLAGR